MLRVLIAVLAAVLVLDGGLAERLAGLTRGSVWTLAATIPVGFDAFHPQGMVKIGDTFFVSSVDKSTRAGHLFKIDHTGKLLADLRLVEGQMYHPGGIDYDGHDIWVPLAEYRPSSHSIVYRVDPRTMKATEVVRVADHIGAVVHNTDDRTLHGVNWGSRRFYKWKRDGAGPLSRMTNPSHYVDFQDCHYIGKRRMICGGISELSAGRGSPQIRLGGLEVVNLTDGRPIHQVPIVLTSPRGAMMTQNPFWIETHDYGLRAYFMPEDNRSSIYVYDISVAPR